MSDFESISGEQERKEKFKPENRLIPLLSFSDCQSEDHVLKRAKKIASEILSHWYIYSFGDVRKILEIEFYIFIPQLLEDSSVHDRPELMTAGRFYTHTKSLEGKWSPPIFNRHGIDITCGDESQGIRAGILLRHIDGKGHRAGPGLTLRTLLRGDAGFKTLSSQASDFGWSSYERDYLEELSNSSVFKGKTRLAFIGGENEAVRSDLRVGIEKSSHAHLPLRFFL